MFKKVKQKLNPNIKFPFFFETIRIRFGMLSLIFFKYTAIMSRHQTFRISSCSFCRGDRFVAHTLFSIICQQFPMGFKCGFYQVHPTYRFSYQEEHLDGDTWQHGEISLPLILIVENADKFF